MDRGNEGGLRLSLPDRLHGVVIIVPAFIGAATGEVEARRFEKRRISIFAERSRRPPRQHVRPFAALARRAEEEAPAGLQRRRDPPDGFLLIVFGKQKQQPDRDRAVERAVEERALLRGLVAAAVFPRRA